MRFHLIAPPNVQTTKEYSLDGFGVCCIRFAKMMKDLGHTVILYGSEENEAPCDEFVSVITKATQKTLLMGSQYQYAGADDRFHLWDVAGHRTWEEITKRKQPRDFICTTGGIAHQKLANSFPDLMTVEYSIGYSGSFSKYRVYQSHIWRHCTLGFQKGIANQFGDFFHTVIPYFFDEAEYPFQRNKEPFALYTGRLITNKGLVIACKAAKLAGIPLKIIGHGDKKLVTDGAEYLGVLDDEERNNWMARASVFIHPTLYLEPFGSAPVEAQFCGTPVVTTDFGAFIETVEKGKTGFRCNYMGEFVQALKDASSLDPVYIRKRAVDTYSMNVVKHQYQKYFDRLMLLWGKGFDTVENSLDVEASKSSIE